MDTCRIIDYIKSRSELAKSYTHAMSKIVLNYTIAAAAWLGDLNYLMDLCEQGDIGCRENLYLGNPLRSAIVCGHYQLAKLLLDHGIAADQGGTGPGHGPSPLQTAAFTGRQDFVDLLLDSKYDCPGSGANYESAINEAAIVGHLSILKDLVRRSTDQQFPTQAPVIICSSMLRGTDKNRSSFSYLRLEQIRSKREL